MDNEINNEPAMKILACQINVEGINTRSKRDSNLDRIHSLIRKSCDHSPVDLVLLPELSTVEYSVNTFDNLLELAEPLFGPSFEKYAALAKSINSAICYGFPREEAGRHYISQMVIDNNGEYLCHYDKLHVAQFGASGEGAYFQPGDHSAVFSINGFRIGVIICYDLRFGSYISQLAEQNNLDLILHPVAFYRDGSFASWHHFVKTRALENQLYFLSLNQSGDHWGDSLFCPPWFENESEVQALDLEEQLQIFEISREVIAKARSSYPILKNRKPDYEGVLRELAIPKG